MLDSNLDSAGKPVKEAIRRVLDPGDWIIDTWKTVYGCSAKTFVELGWCFSYDEAIRKHETEY